MEDFDGKEIGLLGDAVHFATDSASDVSSVAKSVCMIIKAGPYLSSAALEVFVRDANAGVDDIGIRIGAGGGTVLILCGTWGAVRNACQTPWCIELGGEIRFRRLVVFFFNARMLNPVEGPGSIFFNCFNLLLLSVVSLHEELAETYVRTGPDLRQSGFVE